MATRIALVAPLMPIFLELIAFFLRLITFFVTLTAFLLWMIAFFPATIAFFLTLTLSFLPQKAISALFSGKKPRKFSPMMSTGWLRMLFSIIIDFLY